MYDSNVKWEDLTISNDFIFSKVMRDEEICKQVINVLLDIKVSKIKYLQQQKNINLDYDKKSICLDVYVEDEDKIYNIEMQTTNQKELAKRARYYQNLIDLNTLEKGKTYNHLKVSYVIFICTFDPFKEGLPKYTFQNRCDEKHTLTLNDRSFKIFFNTQAFEKAQNVNLKSLLKYINGENDNNSLVNIIDKKIYTIKNNKEWRREYMTLLMREQEIAEYNFNKGVKQGIANSIEILKNIGLEESQIIEKICEKYKITEEQIKKYL